jgi:hypothetical protein
MIGYTKETPIMRGFLVPPSRKNGTMQLTFHCPYCQSWHLHGWDDYPYGQHPCKHGGSHRVEHCTNQNSAFRETGYNIKPYTQEDLRYIGKLMDDMRLFNGMRERMVEQW